MAVQDGRERAIAEADRLESRCHGRLEISGLSLFIRAFLRHQADAMTLVDQPRNSTFWGSLPLMLLQGPHSNCRLLRCPVSE